MCALVWRSKVGVDIFIVYTSAPQCSVVLLTQLRHFSTKERERLGNDDDVNKLTPNACHLLYLCRLERRYLGGSALTRS